MQVEKEATIHEEGVQEGRGESITAQRTAQRTSMMKAKPKGGTFSVLVLAQAAARMQLYAMTSPAEFAKMIKSLSRSVCNGVCIIRQDADHQP